VGFAGMGRNPAHVSEARHGAPRFVVVHASWCALQSRGRCSWSGMDGLQAGHGRGSCLVG
jgi:hypothetical protein